MKRTCKICQTELRKTQKKYCSAACWGISQRHPYKNIALDRRFRQVIYECPHDVPHKQDHHFDYIGHPTLAIRLCVPCHKKEHARLAIIAAQAAQNTSPKTSAFNEGSDVSRGIQASEHARDGHLKALDAETNRTAQAEASM